MENIKDMIGCRCRHFSYTINSSHKNGTKTPSYTFPWAETQYLSERPVWPVSQSLDLKLDLDKKVLEGSNTIVIKSVQKEVREFLVDSADLTIESVMLDGKPSRYVLEKEAIRITLDQPFLRGEQKTLKIKYTCQNPRAGIYFISSDEHYKRDQQVWTQGQDDDAKYWFPNFDEPRIKCSFEMKVEVPAGFIATSNGALHHESRSGKHWTFHWKSQFAIPSYLVTLTVGQFSEIKESWRGKPVVYLCAKGRENEAKLSFGKTPQMMELFSQKIGVDYPYEKYSQIAVSEFIFGGMENTSATTQTDATLHPPELDDDYSSDDLVSHELAHQWFGDLVTCKHWSHGWLNEGWATFLEQVFKEQDLGLSETEYFSYQDFQIFVDEDRSQRRPIVTNLYSDPAEVWDRHTYQKAGLVLRALRAELGEEDFWAGTKAYLNEFKGRSVETVDFQRSLEAASGKSLSRFFDQWIYKGGYPEFSASFEWDEKAKLAKFSLKQEQKVDELTPLFYVKSKVDFIFTDNSVKTLEVQVSKAEESFVLPLEKKPDYVRFDAGNYLLKTMKWKVPQDMVEQQLLRDADVVGKVWAMKTLAKEPNQKGTELILSRLKNDSYWGVRAEAATALGEIKSQAALQGLIQALRDEKRSKVRKSICAALGNFRDISAFDALKKTLTEETNVIVRGTAASAIGKTRNPEAFELLQKFIEVPAWHDVITAGCINGLKSLRDERALPIFMKFAKYGAPKFSRPNALMAISEFALDRKDVTEFLKEQLEDPNIRIRAVVADALASRKDPSTIGAMESMAHRVVEGHLKTSVFRAVRGLRDSLEKPKELAELKETLEKIQDENRKLRDRLDALEAKAKPLN